MSCSAISPTIAGITPPLEFSRLLRAESSCLSLKAMPLAFVSSANDTPAPVCISLSLLTIDAVLDSSSGMIKPPVKSLCCFLL